MTFLKAFENKAHERIEWFTYLFGQTYLGIYFGFRYKQYFAVIKASKKHCFL